MDNLLTRVADIIAETMLFSPGLEDVCMESEMQGEFGRTADEMIADLRQFIEAYGTKK